jgi:hypothetical protein
MTRKDYELLARALRETQAAFLRAGDNDLASAVRDAAKDIAYALKADNTRFDTLRFMAAISEGLKDYA